MGMRFCTEASNLKSLCRALGDVTLEEIRPDHMEVYLAGKGPITATWERKYSTLKGFYRFAVARGYVNCAAATCRSQASQNIRALHLHAARAALLA
jgi:hypothetical protein